MYASSGELAPLEAGVRASPGRVGYLGSPANLISIEFEDELAPAGTRWAFDGTYLEVIDDDVVIDGYYIPHTIITKGNNTTIRNCIVSPGPGDIYGIQGDSASSGDLVVEDIDIVRRGSVLGDIGGALSTSGATLKVRRVDISGTSDAIQPNVFDGTLISQVCVHDLALVDPEAHLDCVQPFQAGLGSGNVSLTIEHSWLDAVSSTDPAVIEERTEIVTPNSAVTLGGNAPNGFEVFSPLVINNNYMGGGSYHLRMLFDINNVSVTDNDFGPEIAFGEYLAENPSAIVAWSGNKLFDGSTAPPP